MAVAMSVLLDDLRAETAVLDALLTPLAPDRWDKPTPAPGWVVRDQVSHLAHFDEVTTRLIATFAARAVGSRVTPRASWGPPDAAATVRGPAEDFCLLVTRRRHRDDLALDAHGDAAKRWLHVAQAFAGPPGRDRVPRGKAP